MGNFKDNLFVTFCLLACGICAFMIIAVELPIWLDILLLIWYSLIWAMLLVYIFIKMED